MTKPTPPPARATLHTKGDGETDKGNTNNDDQEAETKEDEQLEKDEHDDVHLDGRANRARQGVAEKIQEWDKMLTTIKNLIKADYADETKEDRIAHKRAVGTSLSATRELLRQIRKKKPRHIPMW